MAIEIDTTTWNPDLDHSAATAMHIRVIPMLSSTLFELASYTGEGLDRPKLKVRGHVPYLLLQMPYFHQSVWNIGDELMQLAHEISTWE